MINRIEQKKRIKLMAFGAVVVLLLFLALKIPWAALGLVIGTIVGIFNYWLVSRNALKRKRDGKGQNPLGYYLIRLVTAASILIATAFINPHMLLGALFGLTLEMQTYLWDAIKIVFNKT